MCTSLYSIDWIKVVDTQTMLMGVISMEMTSRVAVVVLGPFSTSVSVCRGLTAVIVDEGLGGGTVTNNFGI